MEKRTGWSEGNHQGCNFITITGAPRRNRADCAEKLIRVKILPNVDRYFQIGTSMKDEDRVGVLLFLIQNVDVFTWSPYEVPGVDLEFIVHRLNVNPSFPPKKQKPKRSAKEYVKAVKLEVKKGRGNKGNFLPGVASEYHGSKEEERQMKGLCRFHGFKPSINTTTDVGVAKVGVTVISTIGPCWMDPIIDFLVEERVSNDEKRLTGFCRIAFQYWLLVDRKLYRRSFGGPYLLHLHPEKVNELLAKLHDGVCGNQVGGMLISSLGNDLGILVAIDAEGCCRICA